MSQYYPPQGPMYPPEQGPEGDYYYEDEGDYYEYYDDDENGGEAGNPLLQTILAFIGGGCLVFLCMGFCGLLLVALWILDPGGSSLAATPFPGSDLGLSFDEPAFPDESVTTEQGMQLTILDVNRNASVETIPQAEGREVIIVTIELVNLGEEESNFNERNFMLVNGLQEAYAPALGAVDGALGRGTLPAGEGLEGRLVYEIIADEFDLRMLWEPASDAPRYIYLE